MIYATCFTAGADKVSINSAAVRDPGLITDGGAPFWQSVHSSGHPCPPQKKMRKGGRSLSTAAKVPTRLDTDRVG